MKYVSPAKSKTAFVIFSFALAVCVSGSSNAFAQKVKTQKVKTQKIKSAEYKPLPPIENKTDFDADEFQIFALVNHERAKQGLSQLAFDDEVAKIARAYSKKMATEKFFSHYDAEGKSVLERAKAARLKHWSKIGENLFSIANLADFDDFTVEKWMNSPTHRQNILAPDWTTAGVGIAESEDGEIFITQVFIKR